MNVQIPVEDEEVKNMIRSFARYFSKIEIPSWEATYAQAIFIYLMTHWHNADRENPGRLLKWIEDSFELYRDLHFPFFKKEIKILRGEHAIYTRIKYDEAIATSNPKMWVFENWLDKIRHAGLTDQVEANQFSLMVIQSLIHPSVQELVVRLIKCSPRIIRMLAPFWLKTYPNLEVGAHSFFDYQYRPFKKCEWKEFFSQIMFSTILIPAY